MDDSTRSRIRHIFLTRRPNFVLMTAAELLGMTLKDLRHEIEIGAIVAVPTRLGQRISKEELIAAALQVWSQAVIEGAPGDDGAAVVPARLRRPAPRARLPRD